MKLLLLLVLCLIIGSCKTIQEQPLYKTITDSRDGQKYNYTTIRDQYWMTENMRYNIAGSKWNPANPDTLFGRLYNWEQATKACPDGWVLISSPDWIVLESSVTTGSLQDDLFKKEKFRGNNVQALKSKNYWDTSGTDSLGMNFLPAGGTNGYNQFWGLGELAFFWTATPHIKNGNLYTGFANYRYIDNDSVGVYSDGHKKERFYFSCRCVQYYEDKAEKVGEKDKQYFVDERDGQKYGYVKVKDFYWMTENMRYEVEYSDLNPANPDSLYGRLYASYQALEACPKGWRLPGGLVWFNLESSTIDLYRSEIIFSNQFRGKNEKVLKSKVGWETPGTDEFALNFLPAGKSSLDDGFSMLGKGAFIWGYDASDISFSAHHIVNDSSGVYWRKKVGLQEETFMSCRCVKYAPDNRKKNK
jgi:uncharacterized protein (TIGR02145 family)